ncbi:SIPA1L2 [Acanthosepion pharaonis]|uniref:SIPA1L2 n=1 Tax=Acanthosepion pharaonis TaxID=158019 RepID=A0A812B171_ACAPH|nr:SIPA1L2 [Sepia pharaonis]
MASDEQLVSSKRGVNGGSSHIMVPDTSQNRPKQTVDFYKQHILSDKTPPSSDNNNDVESNVQKSGSDHNGVLDSSPGPSGQVLSPFIKIKNQIIEYVDYGAHYYRNYFYGLDHQNYFGIDENLGPIAVSIKKEKTERENLGSKSEYGQTQYRIIFRTSELATHRGSILEDAIPSSSRLSSSRGVSSKDVLEYVLPEVNLSCLKQAISGQKIADQLMKLDEQGITTSYKVGIMYCKADQSTEEEMYNNEIHGPAFEEFLECIGTRVRLKGFDKYRGQLDNKMDSTGTHSIYSTFNNYEIMFHVSTLLPFTPSNRQQLLRKRHIGNDIVSIVFQEPGALPFTPKSVRSHFQHVFIIVRVHNPNTPEVSYSVAVSRCKDVPPFGPPIPETPFKKGPEFTDFLFAKVINGENAAHQSEKFKAMAARTHQEYLRDLATNYVTSTALDSTSKLSKFTLGSGRKKERSKVKIVPDFHAKGATVFFVKVEDHGFSKEIDCLLGIAAEYIVFIEDNTKDVIYTIPCSSILGWTAFTNSLKLYHNQGDCVEMRPSSGESYEVVDIVSRLSGVTRGCQTQEMTLRRNDIGQLGFHIQAEGIVTEVEHYGFAWEAGIRKEYSLSLSSPFLSPLRFSPPVSSFLSLSLLSVSLSLSPLRFSLLSVSLSSPFLSPLRFSLLSVSLSLSSPFLSLSPLRFSLSLLSVSLSLRSLSLLSRSLSPPVLFSLSLLSSPLFSLSSLSLSSVLSSPSLSLPSPLSLSPLPSLSLSPLRLSLSLSLPLSPSSLSLSLSPSPLSLSPLPLSLSPPLSLSLPSLSLPPLSLSSPLSLLPLLSSPSLSLSLPPPLSPPPLLSPPPFSLSPPLSLSPLPPPFSLSPPPPS